MDHERRRVALALMAHPDDAEIFCGGVLIQLTEAGWDVHIATMTPGDCGTVTDNAWRISAIRTEEADRAAAMIGAHYYCLDERDGLVVYDKPTIRKATDLLRRVTPTLMFTHPHDDYMQDHEMTSRVARMASFLYAAPNASPFVLHPEAGIPHLYYCDPMEGRDHLGREVTPTTTIDVSGVMDRKVEMLSSHASQREWLRAHHGMDEYVDAMKRQSAHRGEQAGVEYAEAFVQHRGHAYPADDLLVALFGAAG